MRTLSWLVVGQLIKVTLRKDEGSRQLYDDEADGDDERSEVAS